MPTLSASTTLSLPAGQAFVFEAGSGTGTAVADPNGRNAKYSIGPQQTAVGPFSTAVNVSVVITSGTIGYRVDATGSDQADQKPEIAALSERLDGRAGIDHLRRALAWPKYDRVLGAYIGTVTVTPGNASSTKTLVAASTGAALVESKYIKPAPVCVPRTGATAFIECRAAHTGNTVVGNPGITRARWMFFTDAPVFEVQMYGVLNSGYSLLVDGNLVSAQATKANNGTTYYDVYDFSAETNGRRPKLVEIYGDGSFYFAGIRVTAEDSVWRAEKLPRMIVLGDSYTADGSTAVRGWSATLARGLGVHEYRSGVGSTGYLSTNGGASLTFRQRLAADVSAHAPEVICIAGGINDIPGYSSNTWTVADLQSEASALYAQALSENPNALVIVLGPWRGSSGNAGSYSTPAMDTALQAAAEAQPEHGGRLIYIPTLNDQAGPWQFGNTSSGNFFVYGSGDGTHVNEAGGTYLGNRAIEGIRRVIEQLY